MKNTKRSMLVSGLCLLLTAVMLMGSTFAWFTDSVTNEGNTIQSGTLDISLNPGSTEELFSSEGFLFEPGRSQKAVVAVSNTGSLWLKYTMSFANVKTTGDADITEVLDVYKVDPDDTSLDDSAKYLGTMKDLMAAGKLDEEAVLSPGAADSFALVIKMQESANNKYQKCGVAFDVTAVATQYNSEHEQDGFGNSDYDKDAKYPLVEQSATELQEKLDSMVSGDTVTVNPGVTKASVFSIDGDGTFVVQGGTEDPAETVLEGQILFGANSLNAEGKQLTLRNLTISSDAIALKFNHSAPGVAAEGLTIVLENCIVEGSGTGSFGVLLGTGNRNAKLVLNNVKFVNVDTALAIADNGNANDYVSGATGNKVEMTNVTFENCNNQFQLFNPSVYYKDLADVIAKGDVERFSKVFTVSDMPIVVAGDNAAVNGENLVNAVEQAPEGATVLVMEGDYQLDTKSYSSVPNGTLTYGLKIDKSITLLGQGDVDFLSSVSGYNSGMILFTKYDVDVTIDGIDFDGGAWDIIGCDDPGVRNVTITNCSFNATGVNGTPIKLKLQQGEISGNTFAGSQCGYGVRIIGLNKNTNCWPNGMPSEFPIDIVIADNDFTNLTLNTTHTDRGVVQINTVDAGTVTVSNNTFAETVIGETVKNDNSVAEVVIVND